MDEIESLAHAKWECIGFIKGKSAIHIARSDPRAAAERHGPALLGPGGLRLHRGTR